MQLDLFSDNRPNILLNIADEYLLAGDFKKALSTCEQVRDEYPGNRHASELCVLIQKWHAMIDGLEPSCCQPQQLNELYINLGPVSHPALRTAIMDVLIDRIKTLPESDFIFIPPRFHRGHLLIERARFSEATNSFRSALMSPDLERGRFLAWSADALTLAGNAEDAVAFYLQAFLEDPATVEVQSIKHPAITRLHQHCVQNADGIEGDGVAAWLPVWGWLQGIFPLPLQNPAVLNTLETRIGTAEFPVSRIWYDLLTLAEYLRTIQRDDREMAAVRRVMKRLNEEMFECYMHKIRGTKP